MKPVSLTQVRWLHQPEGVQLPRELWGKHGHRCPAPPSGQRADRGTASQCRELVTPHDRTTNNYTRPPFALISARCGVKIVTALRGRYCQHFPISTESTNSGEGGGWGELAYYLKNVDLFVQHIIHSTWTSYKYLACHAPIMDNPENNQHFNVLI